MMEAESEDELIRIGDQAGNLLEVSRKVLEQMVDLLASDGGAEELRAYYQRRLDSPWPDYDARSFGKVEEVEVSERPTHALMMEMLEYAEWERARGHLKAMLGLYWREQRHPSGSEANEIDPETIRWRQLYEAVKTFIREMDEHYS